MWADEYGSHNLTMTLALISRKYQRACTSDAWSALVSHCKAKNLDARDEYNSSDPVNIPNLFLLFLIDLNSESMDAFLQVFDRNSPSLILSLISDPYDCQTHIRNRSLSIANASHMYFVLNIYILSFIAW